MKLDKVTFTGEIKSGQLVYKSLSYAQEWIAKYEDCKVKIVIERIRSIRSLAQNRFYWAYLRLISESTGHEPLELHDCFKREFLAISSKQIYGKEVVRAKSTTRLSIGEFINYMVQIEALTGIQMPNPEEYWEEGLSTRFQQGRSGFQAREEYN